MDRTQELNTWMKILTVGLVAQVAGFVSLLVLPTPDDSRMPSALFFAVILALVGGGLTLLIALAVLASKLGKSWITWVGLSIIVPGGIYIAYFMMYGRVREARSSQTAAA